MTDQLTRQGAGDWCLLGGERSPGLCTVIGADSPRKWDERVGFGLSGAWTIYLGIGVSSFSIKFKLYGKRDVSPDWVAWNKFDAAVLMKPPKNKRPKTLDIWHRELERLKIKSVGVKNVKQPVDLGKGEWEVEVEFIEYRLPKLTMAKPEGSQAKPTDPVDKEIEALTAQLEALAAG